MPTKIEESLPPEILKKARTLIEAVPEDYDWGPLMRAVDAMMRGLADLQDIDFDELYRVADESVQLLKLQKK